MGVVGMSVALGLVLGPMLGGILYHHFEYFAVFTSAYALVGLDFLFRVFMVTEKDSEPERSIVKTNNPSYGTVSTNGAVNADTPFPEEPQDEMNRSASSSSRRTSSTTMSTESTTSTDSLLPPDYTDSTQNPPNPQRHPIIVLLTSSRMWAALLGDFIQSLILTGLNQSSRYESRHYSATTQCK